MSLKNKGLNFKKMFEGIDNPQVAGDAIEEIFESKDPKHVQMTSDIVENFSLQELAMQMMNEGFHPWQLQQFSGRLDEAVNTTLFAVITDTLVSKQVLKGYRDIESTLSKLVTPFNSRLKVDTVPGGVLIGGNKETILWLLS